MVNSAGTISAKDGRAERGACVQQCRMQATYAGGASVCVATAGRPPEHTVLVIAESDGSAENGISRLHHNV